MRKLSLVIVLAIGGLLATGAHLVASKSGEAQSDADSAKRIADESMSLLEKGSLQEMFASLQRNLDVPESEFSSLQNLLKHQREIIAPKFGKPVGEVEFVRMDKVGDSFVRFIYVEKWDRSAVVWKLIFYRPTDTWRLTEITWNDKPTALFP